jgi:hypothetical protein
LKTIFKFDIDFLKKLTLLPTPRAMARPNHSAVPCMAARQGGDVAQGPGKAADVAEALLRRRSWRGSDAPSAMARQR